MKLFEGFGYFEEKKIPARSYEAHEAPSTLGLDIPQFQVDGSQNF